MEWQTILKVQLSWKLPCHPHVSDAQRTGWDRQLSVDWIDKNSTIRFDHNDLVRKHKEVIISIKGHKLEKLEIGYLHLVPEQSYRRCLFWGFDMNCFAESFFQPIEVLLCGCFLTRIDLLQKLGQNAFYECTASSNRIVLIVSNPYIFDKVRRTTANHQDWRWPLDPFSFKQFLQW